jgi:hypothetical protein
MLTITRLLNEMKERKVITDYAVGGATGLIYYFEPIQTQDIDVFMYFENQKSLLVSLEPIYEFMRERGGIIKNEYILIHNTPVQFLVPYNPLIEDAIQKAKMITFMEEPLRIFSLEYLMAIMVQTSRGKDRARLEEIIKANVNIDFAELNKILTKHQLTEKWNKVQSGFDL